MQVTVKELNRVDLVTVEGRVDGSTAPQFGTTLKERIDQGTNNLVIDLGGVEYMSSAGLRELVAALKKVKSAGGDVRLCNLSERVSDVLDLAGLTAIFRIYADAVEAVGSF